MVLRCSEMLPLPVESTLQFHWAKVVVSIQFSVPLWTPRHISWSLNHQSIEWDESIYRICCVKIIITASCIFCQPCPKKAGSKCTGEKNTLYLISFIGSTTIGPSQLLWPGPHWLLFKKQSPPHC